MKLKKEVSLLTFGVFLLIVGSILKFTGNSQANLVMGIGLIFELLAVLLFAWKKIKK